MKWLFYLIMSFGIFVFIMGLLKLEPTKYGYDSPDMWRGITTCILALIYNNTYSQHPKSEK